MIRLVLLIPVLCTISVLAGENDCSDRVLSHGVRDTSCDHLVLKGGQDLTANIQPVDNMHVFKIWLSDAEGEIDETSFPQLRGQITKFSFFKTNLSKFVVPDMPKLEEMEIAQSNVSELTAESFKNVPNLKQLIFRSNPDIKFEPKPFKFLPNLKTLIIDYQNFPQLGKEFLWGVENLELFSLLDNNVEKLDENIFENTTKITDLDIREPKLTKIEANTFKQLKQLKSLDLRGSNLNEFSIDILSEQSELTSLGLQTKFLVNIGLKNLKEHLPKLSELKIIEDDEDLPEMENIKKLAKELNIEVTGTIILE